VQLLRDRRDGRSRGIAYVTFSAVQDAERALDALDGLRSDQQPARLCVSFAPDRTGGEPSRSSLASQAVAAATAMNSYKPQAPASPSCEHQGDGWQPRSFSLHELDKGGPASAPVHPPQASDNQTAEPAAQAATTSGFVYDEASGYYYDATSGYFYDMKTQLYYHPATQSWYKQNAETGAYDVIPAVDSAQRSNGASTAGHDTKGTLPAGSIAAPSTTAQASAPGGGAVSCQPAAKCSEVRCTIAIDHEVPCIILVSIVHDSYPSQLQVSLAAACIPTSACNIIRRPLAALCLLVHAVPRRPVRTYHVLEQLLIVTCELAQAREGCPPSGTTAKQSVPAPSANGRDAANGAQAPQRASQKCLVGAFLKRKAEEQRQAAKAFLKREPIQEADTEQRPCKAAKPEPGTAEVTAVAEAPQSVPGGLVRQKVYAIPAMPPGEGTILQAVAGGVIRGKSYRRKVQ
jgi:hypothetical protein